MLPNSFHTATFIPSFAENEGVCISVLLQLHSEGVAQKRSDLRSRLISRCRTFSGSTMASRLLKWRLWSCKWAKADVAALLVLTDWSSLWLSPTLPLAWSLKVQVIFHCSKTQNNKNNRPEKTEPVREVGFSRYTFLRNQFPITKKLFNPRCFIFLVN